MSANSSPKGWKMTDLSDKLHQTSDKAPAVVNYSCNLGTALPMFMINLDGQVVAWNDACAFLTGISENNILGHKEYWRPFYRQDSLMPCTRLLSNVKKALGGAHLEKDNGIACEISRIDFPMRDGTQLLYMQAGIIYEDDTAIIWQMFHPVSLKEMLVKSGVISDILDKMPIPMVFIENEHIIGANKAVSDMSGFNIKNDIIGKSIYEYITDDDMEKFKFHIRDNHMHVISGKDYIWKYLVHGKIRYIRSQPKVFKISSETFNIVSITDITNDIETKKMIAKEKKKIVEQHKRMNKEIIRANQIYVGSNKKMQNLIAKAGQLARSDISIVIRGETGTGKSQLAKYIHDLSGRAGKPFVAVNCAAIPRELLESEFFGYARGAFSGATENRTGYLAAANGGTLFLDEVGECSLAMQAKLLTAIEKKKFFPVGSRQAQETDFRLICATNQDLVAQCEQGRIREDFLYRIMVGEISIPPLRERLGDLSALIDFLLNKLGDTRPMPQKIRKALYSYKWPGNIRELQNVLLRWLVTGELQFIDCTAGPAPSASQTVPHISDNLNLEHYLERAERKCILEALNAADGRKDRAAVLLGLNIRTMHRKCKKLGV